MSVREYFQGRCDMVHFPSNMIAVTLHTQARQQLQSVQAHCQVVAVPCATTISIPSSG